MNRPKSIMKSLSMIAAGLGLAVALTACESSQPSAPAPTPPRTEIGSTPQTPSQPATPKPEVGKPAPDFTLQDTAGKTWKLSNQKGKLVFLNFWATWCPPCIEELPAMDALNRRMSRENFTMITVLYNDDPKKAGEFVKSRGFELPILLDPDARTYGAYGLTGVPETFIIDKDGILREWIIGPAAWTGAGAINMIAQYLPPKGG